MNESEIDVPTALSIPLGVYNFIASFFGIAGNGIVIYSSIRYNAIQLDAVSLELVRNLALADMMSVICNTLPNFITLSVRRWVLGPIYCYIHTVCQGCRLTHKSRAHQTVSHAQGSKEVLLGELPTS
eukprot:sb/3475492/